MSNDTALERNPSTLVYAMAIVLMLIVGIGIVASTQMQLSEDGATEENAVNGKIQLMDHSNIASGATQKLSSPLTITLDSELGSDPVDPNESFTLEATVNASFAASNVEIEWVVPEGVEVMSGNEDYTVASIEPGSPHTSTITLNTQDYSNYKIHFTASAKSGTSSFSQVRQYNTQLQSQYEKSSKDLGLRHKSFLKAQGKVDLKHDHSHSHSE